LRHSLVTGGAGFIGSHLTEALLARGDRVTVVDDLSTGSLRNLHGVAQRAELCIVEGSVGDSSVMEPLLTDVDRVYHLAAAVGVALIAEDPIRTIETNVAPTAALLKLLVSEPARRQRVKLFIASSSEVYGKNPKPRWNEDDDLVFGPTTRPRWSYGVTKAIDEFLALAYYRQHGLSVVVGRFFNVVGPRQTGSYGMVLPRLVSAALAGGPLVVHDDGQQVRCFAHVADVVRVVLALVETPAAVGRAFNIGSDQPVTILDLARRVAAQVNPALRIVHQSYQEAYSEDFEDVRSRVPDLSRLRELVDCTPQHELDQTIREVIESLRA